MIKLSEAEKGYIAGMIDGEGSIMLQKASNYSTIVVVIYNSQESLMNWLHGRLQGYVHINRSPKGTFAYNKPRCMWRLTSTRCYELLRLVYPYLVLKRRQAELAMRNYQLVQKQKTTYEIGTLLKPEYIAERKSLYDLIRLANT